VKNINKTLDEALTLLYNEKVKENFTKSTFFQSSIEFLGHRLTANSICPFENFIDKMANLKKPQSIKETQRLLGGFYFVKKLFCKYGELTQPLFLFLKNGIQRLA
jgi:hypothetical protein